MSDAPIKTTYLKGNLNQGATFSSQICEQSTNISHGLWHICVSSICIDCKDPNGAFCSISCNLVKDKKLNSVSKIIEQCNPSIATVFVKGRKIVYVDKTWFIINNQCTDLKLFFSNIETNDRLLIDCELVVTLLLQRIK
jgi:hypothetical protein